MGRKAVGGGRKAVERELEVGRRSFLTKNVNFLTFFDQKGSIFDHF